MLEKIINYVLKRHLVQKMIGYGLISIVATSVDFALLYSLTEYVGIYYLMSAAIAYVVGALVSYNLNKKYNFVDDDKRVVLQFSKFLFIASIGLLINLVVIRISVEQFELHYMVGRVIALIFSFTWNFSGHYFFSFTKQKY